MNAAVLLVYLVLVNTPEVYLSVHWEVDSFAHIAGSGARIYCDRRRIMTEEAFRGLPGDGRVICVEDLEVET